MCGRKVSRSSVYIDDQAVATGDNATYKEVGTTDETDITDKTNANGVYYEIPELLPTDLNTEYTVTFGTKTYKFSALSWAKRVMENLASSDKNKAMANVLYQYYTTANAFANS